MKSNPHRRLARSLLGLVGAVLALAACGGSGQPGASRPASIWVAAWAVSPANAVPTAADQPNNEQTFREIVKPSVSSRGTARLHFSNAFGSAPITLGAVHVGLHGTGAAVVPGTDVPLTFGGQPSVTIAAGATVLSDPAPLRFPYGATLAITEYVAGSWPALTQHNHTGLVTNYATPRGTGNATADTAGAAFTQPTGEYFLFDRVDVLGDYAKTVAVLGSSTTEGYGSDVNAFDDLVSDIATDLHAAGRDDTAVVNLALTPDSLLTINVLVNNPAVVDRFARDVLSIPGIGTVIQNASDVDLKVAHCSSAATILAGDQNVIAQAHAANIRILLAKVAPTTFCGANFPNGFGSRYPANTGQDAERQALNAWMSTTQPSVVDGVTVQPPGADGVVDLSTPVTDPSNTGYLLPQYDVGDASHLNAAGQAVQAAAVPLGAL